MSASKPELRVHTQHTKEKIDTPSELSEETYMMVDFLKFIFSDNRYESQR